MDPPPSQSGLRGSPLYESDTYDFTDTNMLSKSQPWGPQLASSSNDTLAWNIGVHSSMFTTPVSAHQAPSTTFGSAQVAGNQDMVRTLEYTDGEANHWAVASNVADFPVNSSAQELSTDPSSLQSDMYGEFFFTQLFPGFTGDPALPNVNWHGSDSGPYAAPRRSPSYNALPSANMGLSPIYSQGTMDIGITGLPHSEFDSSMPIPSMEKRGSYGQPALRQESSGTTNKANSWIYTGYYNNGSFKAHQRLTASATNSFGAGENKSRGSLGASSASSPTSDSVTQRRKREDEFLLEMKARGWTYKQIKKEIKNSKVAESTLRGRYRSLTKDRKDRVRKPVWTARDEKLLKESVDEEVAKLRKTDLSREQQLSKISWKVVASSIARNGGSYHFGNATCKKKFLDVDTDPSY